MEKKEAKDMPFWVVKCKDNDGNHASGDGFMWGYRSKKEADEYVNGLYKSGYRGVVYVIPKPET